jgi:hypothetical protein
MTRGMAAAALLAALAASRPRQTEGAGAGLFVYEGAGCTGRAKVPGFEAYLGRATDGVADFLAFASWDDLDRSARWALGCWKNTGKRVALGVPLLPKDGSTLQAGAAGAYDAHFLALGRAIVQAGAADAFLRIGVEFNGDWFPWAAARDPVAFKTYFARAVKALRSAPGARFQIVWNPNVGPLRFPADRAYPGDGVVDVIGLDVYNQVWAAADRDPASRWEHLVQEPFGLAWVAAFARQHGKPIALPEWGTGTRPDGHGAGDDPLFITRMAAWIAANGVVFQSYWDYRAPDYDARLSDGQFPASARAFKAAFGP